MKNPEKAIERVLTGLRDAEAPMGMEARILSALDARVERKDSRATWREWMTGRPVGRGEGWRLAGGAVVAGICALAILVMSTHRASQIEPDGRSVHATASRVFGGTKELVPQRLKPQGRSGGYGTAEAVPLSKTVVPETASASSKDEAPVDYDSLAVSEMLAPSRPAPPLPPTRQEMLLAQVVHHGDPEEVAELKPEVRTKEIELAKAEFHDFFEPPMPVKDNE